VARTEKEIDRVVQIVRQMYDLHRPNQERNADVRIDETLGEVVLMLEPLRRRYGVHVEIEGPLPIVNAHIPEGALRQVLFSLVTNAIEASPPEGIVRLGMVLDSQELVVSISDQGNGIPRELRSRIFEPFFSTKIGKGAEGGLGLGLPTARQLTEVLGGVLDYESECGNGTVFRIHLPLARIKGVCL
jgi:signal transduction histidine kinase